MQFCGWERRRQGRDFTFVRRFYWGFYGVSKQQITVNPRVLAFYYRSVSVLHCSFTSSRWGKRPWRVWIQYRWEHLPMQKASSRPKISASRWTRRPHATPTIVPVSDSIGRVNLRYKIGLILRNTKRKHSGKRGAQVGNPKESRGPFTLLLRRK